MPAANFRDFAPSSLRPPRPPPRRLSVTKVLRASNFRYNSVLGDRTPLHLRPCARMSLGARRRMVLTALKNIEKLLDPGLSETALKKCRARRPSDAKNLVTTARATTSRTFAQPLATILPSSPKFRINISHQGAEVRSRKLKTTVEDSLILRPRLAIISIHDFNKF